MKGVWIVLVLIVLAAAIVLPTTTITQTNAVTGKFIENYTVSVPVVKTLVNDSNQRQCMDVDLQYSETWDHCKYDYAEYRITNHDKVSGEWVVFVGYKDADGRVYGQNSTSFIAPGEYGLMLYDNTNNSGNDCYAKVVKVPTRSECQDVALPPRYYNITEMHDETRSREVEQTVPNTTTTRVNWLFGFKPLI